MEILLERFTGQVHVNKKSEFHCANVSERCTASGAAEHDSLCFTPRTIRGGEGEGGVVWQKKTRLLFIYLLLCCRFVLGV